MLCGAAQADITPLPGAILQGHYTTNPSRGVLHPLGARAAAFSVAERTVIIITLDVVGVSLETTGRIRERLRQALGVHPHNVMVAASHTHCAPATVTLLELPVQPAWLATLEDAAIACATGAVANLRPVRLAVGASAAHFNVNRRPLPGATGDFSVNFGGVCDKRVRTLQAVDLRGRPVATLFHYTCHPTAKSGAEGLISPDYPGVACSAIEQETAAPALFIPGAFANIRPLILDAAGQFTSASAEQLQSLGDELAGAVLRAVHHARPLDADLLDARQTDLTLPFAPGLSDEALRALLANTTPVVAALKHPWAQRLLRQRSENVVPLADESIMQLLRIGPVSLLSIPGEPVQEIGLSIERLASSQQPHLWSVGYTNDMLGYLVTEQQKQQGGYEPSAYPYFNRPAGYAGEQSQVEAAAVRLLGL